MDKEIKRRFKKFFRKKESKEEKSQRKDEKSHRQKERKAEGGGGSKDSAPLLKRSQEATPKVTKAPKKYENVEKAKKIEDEEKEEFEVVQNARPAVCRNKRKAKLQWKTEEEHKSESDKVDEEKLDEAVPKDRSPATPPSSQLGAAVIDPLKDALADLTVEKRQLKETIDRLKRNIRKKDRRISELEFAVKEKEEPSLRENECEADGEVTASQLRHELEAAKATIRKQKEKAMADAEEIKKLKSDLAKAVMLKEDTTQEEETESSRKEDKDERTTSLVAVRVLKVMRRNQLLDDALDFKETQELHTFFTSSAQGNPSDRILMLLDKAIGTGINKLVRNAHEVNDVIDNSMRQFLLKSNTAKSSLLDSMLCHLEYLPAAWGGKMMALASQRAVRKLKHRRNAVKSKSKKSSGERKSSGEKKSSGEREKPDKRMPPKDNFAKSAYFNI